MHSMNDNEGTPYGHEIKKKYFMMSSTLVNLNHGSFGATPRVIHEEQIRYKLIQESHPDRWFRETYFPFINNSRQAIADMIHGNVEDVVLVENVSSSVNSILRSFPFKKGDKVLRLNTSYQMVIETLDWLAKTIEIEIIEVVIKYPVNSSNEIISALKDTYSMYKPGDIKMAIFSHISSMPTMIEPVKEMTAIAHDHGSIVMIDGAHAPGHVPIDVQDINAEFYTGNCHKWMFTPKGTAFLWVKHDIRTATFPEPTVISSTGYNDYIGKFSYTGTRDYTALATIPDGLKYRLLLGGDEKIYDYCHHMIVRAARYLAATWGTYLLVEDDSMLGFMANVVLPTDNSQAMDYMTAILDSRYGIFMVARDLEFSNPLKAIEMTSSDKPSSKRVLYTRLSAQVYNEFSDFEQLGTLVPILIQEYFDKNRVENIMEVEK